MELTTGKLAESSSNIPPAGDPIALTGFGLVSAAGAGADALWEALVAQRCCLRELEQIDTRGLSMRRGGEVPDDVLEVHPAARGDVGAVMLAMRDRAFRMASLALEESLRRAQLEPGARRRVGLALGTALGSIQTLETAMRDGVREGTEWRDVPQRALRHQLARRFGLSEPTWSFSITCVSGLYAIEQALSDLRLGRADAVVCGGLDTLSLFMQSGFCALKALSPTGGLRPFDEQHDGIVLGEGAAFVVLEPLSRACSRGAPIAGVLLANELSSDATHMTSPDGSGRGMAQAITRALSEAGVTWRSVGCVTPTATGSPIYDRMQSRAVLEAMGDGGANVPVTTWEPSVGHALASTGVLGIVHAALLLEHGEILPTFGTDTIDPDCGLRYVVDRPMPLEGDAVLALTVGFGGQNGATLLGRAPKNVKSPSVVVNAPPPIERDDPTDRDDDAPAVRLAALAVVGSSGDNSSGAATSKIAVLLGSDIVDPIATDPETLAALFPGRWNARRHVPAGLGVAVAATATALERAGWWTRGQEELVDGGLVLGSDFQSIGEALQYARDLVASGPAGASPTGFLFSLPSSAAAVLGILFGLKNYQATLTGGATAGIEALQHAHDRLSLRRASRLVAGALTIVTPELAEILEAAERIPRETIVDLELAVVVCLETSISMAPDESTPATIGSSEIGAVREVIDVIPAPLRTLAAPALLDRLCGELTGSVDADRHAGESAFGSLERPTRTTNVQNRGTPWK